MNRMHRAALIAFLLVALLAVVVLFAGPARADNPHGAGVCMSKIKIKSKVTQSLSGNTIVTYTIVKRKNPLCHR